MRRADDDLRRRRRRYYRCSTHHSKGTCTSDLKAREPELRTVVLDAIRAQIQSPTRIAEVRRTIAERLRDYSKGMDAELKDRATGSSGPRNG